MRIIAFILIGLFMSGCESHAKFEDKSNKLCGIVIMPNEIRKQSLISVNGKCCWVWIRSTYKGENICFDENLWVCNKLHMSCEELMK